MTPTSVGMRCPECSRERTKVKTVRSISGVPSATQALIGLNLIVFLAQTAAGGGLSSGGGGWVFNHGVLFGPFVEHQHEYWRLVTSGFLHIGIFHILVNMVSLYFVGSALEPAVGRARFVVIYAVSLLAGSFGALLFTPLSPTAGASGAIFGIFGALIVVARSRGIPIWQSGLGFFLVLNLIVTLTYRGISVGGHLGGLVAGLLCGLLIVEVGERRRMSQLALSGCALLGVLSVVGAIAVAGSHGIAPNGLTL
jgi:membrane associated rhomboid family serine protease